MAEDVIDDLSNVARLLAAIRNLDPINQPQDKERLTSLLQELNSVALERLNELLRKIANEVPQMKEKEWKG